MDSGNNRDILIPKEHVRKVDAEKVEILDAGETRSSKNPFEGTPFQFKNIKVISSGPLVFLLPILLPLILLLMLVLFIPLMIFGRFFLARGLRR